MHFSDLDDPPPDAPAPQYDAARRVYFWVRGEPADPAHGILAPAVFDEIVFLTRFAYFETRAGAIAAVDVVRLRAEYKIARDAG